ncbi:MAG: D-alanyl-D-alanine carboxypeptidase family protein, partial [Clostridia bacterium]|nr:D-alanyl-D-alanine carboxypeptidase family protein [Clostridia bacterium]
MAKKINNPYLIVINKDNKFNVDNYNGLKYVDVDVRQGDQGKNKSYIEKQTLQAYEQARLELQSIGGDCWINSAGRTENDQKFAIEEKYNQIYMDKLKQAGLDQIPQNELSAEQQQLIMSLQQEARKETDDVTLPIGFSEHQCGLAIDIGVDMTKVKIPDNIKQNYPENTPQGFLNFSTRRLIMENHGFILRYPENARLREVTGVKKPEGWHWRYVEPEHSQ